MGPSFSLVSLHGPFQTIPCFLILFSSSSRIEPVHADAITAHPDPSLVTEAEKFGMFQRLSFMYLRPYERS